MRHERDLAESSRAGVGLDQLAQHRFTALRLDADDAALRKPHAEILDQRAAVTERLGRSNDAVDAVFVRDGEHFFCRQVRRKGDAGLTDRPSADPHMPGR